MWPKLSTRKLSVVPSCVMLPKRPSTTPITSPTMSVTLLIKLSKRGLRSRDSKTRFTISTKLPNRTTRSNSALTSEIVKLIF